MNELKGAMIGAGYFANFQAEAWNRMTSARIVAVADPMPGRAEAFAERWKIPRAYTDSATMLACEKPDFVDAATRPETHREIIQLAASAGVHIICQKPMAPSWEECVALVKLCSEAKVRLLMHENWRWQPWYREMKRLLESGALGNPFHISFRMRTGDGRGPEPYPAQPYFRQMKRLVVYEVAVHFLDTFRFLLGEIASVSCQIKRINPVIAGEDYALIVLEFESGASGLIDANRFSGRIPVDLTLGECRVEGELAMVRLSPDGRLWLTECGRDEGPHSFPTSDLGYKGDSVKATQEHLIACLQSGRPSETEGSAYLPSAAAVFACYRSAEEQRLIRISDDF